MQNLILPILAVAVGLTRAATGRPTDSAHAATAREIDVSVDVALEDFEKEVSGGKEFPAASKGVLLAP